MTGERTIPRVPFARPAVLDVPAEYRALQSDDPITRVRTPAGDEAWLVTRHEHVRALFADERLGRSHPDPERAAQISNAAAFGGPSGDYSDEKEEHLRLRKLFAPSFTVRRMQAMRARLQGVVDELLDRLADAGPPADLHREFSFPLPVLATCELFGVPEEDREQTLAWSRLTTDLFDSETAGSCDAGAAALDQLGGYMYKLIAIKRQNPGEDLVSDLVAAGLDVDEIIGLSAVLFAGHDITVARLDFGVLLLLTNPDQWQALLDDPALVAPAVEEVLRMSAPVDYGLPRYAHADVEIAGVTIRAGEAVLLASTVANRDPRTFQDAERFDVGRQINPHLAFGHGRGFCLGAGLARLELEVAFGAMVRRFPAMRLAAPLDELELRTTHLLGGIRRLPVAW
jgi:cytochrome P450